jgi:hypothetical protein
VLRQLSPPCEGGVGGVVSERSARVRRKGGGVVSERSATVRPNAGGVVSERSATVRPNAGGVVSERSATVRLKRWGGGPDKISYTVLKGGARAASFFGSLGAGRK